jgi:hypothetical protein
MGRAPHGYRTVWWLMVMVEILYGFPLGHYMNSVVDNEGYYSFSGPAFRPFVPTSKRFDFPKNYLGHFSYWFSINDVNSNTFRRVDASAPSSFDVVFGNSFLSSSFTIVRQL